MTVPVDTVRAALIAKADRYFWGIIGSTMVLLVGALMEYFDPLKHLPTVDVNVRTRVRTPRRWMIRLQKSWVLIAVLFVVIGIAGEGIFEFLAARAEGDVRSYDEQVLTDAVKDASTAKQSAKDAADAAGAAKNDSNAAVEASGRATDKANKANEAASAARGSSERADEVAQEAQRRAAAIGEEADALDLRIAEINGEVVAIEPRAVVISKDEASLIQQVSQFVGQKFEVQICGPWIPLDPISREKVDAWGNLVGVLQNGAKWNFENQLPYHWDKCSGFSGVTAFVNWSSSSGTKRAAQALSEELTRVLPDQMFPVLTPYGSEVAPPFSDADSATLFAAKHPDVIVVLIADRIPQKSKPEAKPKTRNKP